MFEQLLAQQQKQEGMQELDTPAMPEQPAQPEIDPALKAALDERDKKRMFADLLGGFQQLAVAPAAHTGMKADTRFADILRKRAEEPVTQYKEQKAAEKQKTKDDMFMQDWQNKLRKSQMDITDREKTADPNSPESKLAQNFMLDLAKKNGQELNEASVKAMSAAELYRVSKPMQDLVVQTMKADLQEQKMKQQEQRLRQADERLDIYREREEGKNVRFKRSQDFKEAEKQEISDKQTEQLAGYDEALGLLSDAVDMKADTDTGFITNISDKMRSMVGKQDVKVSDLKMTIGETLAQKVKALSGTAVSDKEREFIESISLPSINDDDKQFNAKLKRAIETLEKAKKNRIEAYKKQGKDPSAFEDKTKSNEIRRRTKDGRIAIFDENKNFLRYED